MNSGTLFSVSKSTWFSGDEMTTVSSFRLSDISCHDRYFIFYFPGLINDWNFCFTSLDCPVLGIFILLPCIDQSLVFIILPFFDQWLAFIFYCLDLTSDLNFRFYFLWLTSDWYFYFTSLLWSKFGIYYTSLLWPMIGIYILLSLIWPMTGILYFTFFD